MPNTVTIPRIEVCRAGTWRSMLGERTITPEDLASAVEASRDPEISRPRVKIGHLSSLNDMLGDGAPAFGWLTNPSVSEDGKSLFVDLAGVPRKLANQIGKSYRQRSVELRRNVTTPSGKTYPVALSALALLGATAPAVKGLDDLEAIYASEGDDSSQESTEVVPFSELLEIPETQPDLRHVDSGKLDTGQEDTGEVPDPDEKETPTVADTDKKQEGQAVSPDLVSALFKIHEIPEGTPHEDAVKLLEAKANQPVVTKEKAPEAEPKAAEPEADEKLSDGPETVKVSKAVWDDVTGRLSALEKSRAKEHQAKVIETALSEGKISPAERALYERIMAQSPESTETLLSELPSRINVVESGTEHYAEAQDGDDDFNPEDYWAAQGLSDHK